MNNRVRKVRSDKITFSPDDIDRIEKMAGLGFSVKQISAIFGVSTDTLYRRMKESGSDLSAALTKGRSELEFKLASKAAEQALDGNSGMIKYLLGCCFSWTEKKQIVINQDDQDLENAKRLGQKYNLDDLTDNELDELQKLLEAQTEFEDRVMERIAPVVNQNSKDSH